MAFRFIEGIPTSLGVFGVVGSLCMSHAHAIEAVQTSATITPTSPAACIGLESNSDRLACYDALFKVADTAKTTPVIEQKAALNPSPSVEQSELNPQSIKEKIGIFLRLKVQELIRIHPYWIGAGSSPKNQN